MVDNIYIATARCDSVRNLIQHSPLLEGLNIEDGPDVTLLPQNDVRES